MALGKFLEGFERFDFQNTVLLHGTYFYCTGPKSASQDVFGPARWNQNCTSALSERMLPPCFCVVARGHCMSRLSAKEAPPYFCAGVRRRAWPASARRRGARQGASPARSCRAWWIVQRPPIPRARVRQQGHNGLLEGGWLKTADTAPGPPYVTGQSRWPPRPHSSRTDSGLENSRTVPAQPHNPAQLFLPIIAQRCKKVLALRGKPLYIRV
jgi:hypothetical protein